MSCLYGSGYALGCDNISAVGGVKKVYVGSYSADTTYAVDASNIITGATNLNQLYTIEQKVGYAEALEPGTHNENGSYFWSPSITMTFTKNQIANRDLLLAMVGKRLVAFVVDNNNKIFLYGKENGLMVSASSNNLGKAMGDSNETVITLSGMEPNPIQEVSSSLGGIVSAA